MATQSDSRLSLLDSQYDSQVTYNDDEDREERRREQEALKTVEAQNGQRSDQQKKDKEPVMAKAKTKLSKPPTVQKNPPVQQDTIEIDSLSEEEAEITLYKLNVESFWEGEKIAFNTEIEKRQLGGERPSLYLLSASQDSKAREHATSLGHVTCHRVSLVATPSHGSLAAAKQKHFSVPKTGPGEYRQVLNTILEELLDWKHKELQLGLVYRIARNKSGVVEKEPAATKTIPAIITHSGRTQGSRSMSLIDIPTSSTPTGRLLNAQAAEDENDPALAVRRDIRARWKCVKKDCDGQDYPEPACYINYIKISNNA